MRRLALRMVGWSIAFLVTLEVCARVDDAVSYGAPLIGPYDNEILYTYDHLGKIGKPGGRYLKWQLNSDGFRGPDLQPGRFRIMCTGASETFGLYESENGEWPRRLERVLNKRAGRPVFEVVNASYPGLSLATALRRLPGWLNQLQPRVLVVYPSLANYIWLPAIVNPSTRPPKRPFFEPRIAGRVKTLLKSALPAPLQGHIRAFQTEQAARQFKSVMPRLPEANVARFRQDMEAIVDQTDRAGIDLVLVTHATLFGDRVREEHRSLLRDWRKFYPMLAEDGFLDMEQRLNNVIRDVAAKHGKVLVDAARRMPSGHKTFVEFVHFTDEGAEKLADLIANHIGPVIDSKVAYDRRDVKFTQP
jgi:hypothetical protein